MSTPLPLQLRSLSSASYSNPPTAITPSYFGIPCTSNYTSIFSSQFPLVAHITPTNSHSSQRHCSQHPYLCNPHHQKQYLLLHGGNKTHGQPHWGHYHTSAPSDSPTQRFSSSSSTSTPPTNSTSPMTQPSPPPSTRSLSPPIPPANKS